MNMDISVECVYPNNLRYLWRIVDYLQQDAAKKGAKDRKPKEFGSFWNNLDQITQNREKVFVVRNARNHLIGYMVVDKYLSNPDDKYNGTLDLDIFEVLPRYRGKCVGSQMIKWLSERAVARGFNSIRVLPANDSEGFWETLGFDERPADHGLLLPIA